MAGKENELQLMHEPGHINHGLYDSTTGVGVFLPNQQAEVALQRSYQNPEEANGKIKNRTDEVNVGIGARALALIQLAGELRTAHATREYVNQLKDLARDEVGECRQDLEALVPSKRTELDSYVGRFITNPRINEAIGYGEDEGWPNEDVSVVSALTRKAEDGTYTVSDVSFLNWLRHHNYNLRQYNMERQKDLLLLKTDFTNSVREAIVSDVMPVHIESRLHLVDSTFMYVDDGFRTVARNSEGYHYVFKGMDVNKAYKQDERSLVVIAPPNSTLPENPNRDRANAFHELLHVITDDYARRSSESRATDALFGGKEEPSRIFNEAMTEHLSHVLLGDKKLNDLYVPLPSSRYDIVSYSLERMLLECLAQGGNEMIDMRMFVDVQFAEEPEVEEKAALLKTAVRCSHEGRDVLAEVEAITSRKELEVLVRDLRERMLNRRYERSLLVGKVMRLLKVK